VSSRNLVDRLLFFKRVPLFTGLTDIELEALARDFVRREFKQDTHIFQQGDAGQVLYLIETGQVRIYVHETEGQERSVVHYGPCDIFGELAVIDGLPRSASAFVVEDSVVYSLTRDRFRQQMTHSPQLALNFMQALSARMRLTSNQVGNLISLDVPGRLARKLLELARLHGQPGPDGVTIQLAIKQGELGTMVGTTRESINKLLGQFKKQNLIRVEEGFITLLDVKGLQDISG
jgi:CRP/FNR family cyclic AMP-dependent transcriptional regulator